MHELMRQKVSEPFFRFAHMIDERCFPGFEAGVSYLPSNCFQQSLYLTSWRKAREHPPALCVPNKHRTFRWYSYSYSILMGSNGS